jgi:hypothetical protein
MSVQQRNSRRWNVVLTSDTCRLLNVYRHVIRPWTNHTIGMCPKWPMGLGQKKCTLKGIGCYLWCAPRLWSGLLQPVVLRMSRVSEACFASFWKREWIMEQPVFTMFSKVAWNHVCRFLWSPSLYCYFSGLGAYTLIPAYWFVSLWTYSRSSREVVRYLVHLTDTFSYAQTRLQYISEYNWHVVRKL